MTEQEVRHQSGRSGQQTASSWRELAFRLVEETSGFGEDELSQPVVIHGFAMTWRSALIARTFELWTHADDIRRALGRPVEAPEPAVLRAMANVAVAALPLGLTLAGRALPDRVVKMVLTGPGGGTWRVSLGATKDPGGTPDAMIVADVVDFCRLTAQRLDPSELDHERSGDSAVVDDVLVGARMFAA